MRESNNIPEVFGSMVFNEAAMEQYVAAEAVAAWRQCLENDRPLTLEGAKVEAVCEVMPYSGGLTRNIVQCLEDFGIPLYLSHTVTEIHGDARVSGVTVAAVDEKRRPVPGTERYIPCDTLLLSVGLIPENELTRGAGIPMDPITNGASVNENRETGVPGIFACGNVLHVHDLADNVTREAERAVCAPSRRAVDARTRMGHVAS